MNNGYMKNAIRYEIIDNTSTAAKDLGSISHPSQITSRFIPMPKKKSRIICKLTKNRGEG